MKRRILHVIASCTDRKRGEPAPSHRLGAHPVGRHRASSWSRALARGGHTLPAGDLYVGNHWSVARSIAETAPARGWDRAELWAASAGYGLVACDEPLRCYSATFAPRHPDSVITFDAPGAPAEQARAWWTALAQTPRASGRPTSVEALAAKVPDATLLVFASSAYLDAMESDLFAARELLRDPSRLVIVTNEGYRSGPLGESLVSSCAAMRGELGGQLTSLHARVARYLVEHLAPARFRVGEARSIADELRMRSSVQPTPVRSPMTDNQVIAFIRAASRSDGVTASRLLRSLRDSGRACEQKRFKQLFLRARGESCKLAKA